MKVMEARPTEFANVLMRSKLEAMIAYSIHFSDPQWEIFSWCYEPYEGSFDFVITTGHGDWLIEVKPRRPTQAVVDEKVKLAARIRKPAIIIGGNPYDNVWGCSWIMNPDVTERALPLDALTGNIDMAMEYRFDLVPDFHVSQIISKERGIPTGAITDWFQPDLVAAVKAQQ